MLRTTILTVIGLLALFTTGAGLAFWLWREVAAVGTGRPGLVALGLGAGLTFLLGAGLTALIFRSRRRGDRGRARATERPPLSALPGAASGAAAHAGGPRR